MSVKHYFRPRLCHTIFFLFFSRTFRTKNSGIVGASSCQYTFAAAAAAALLHLLLWLLSLFATRTTTNTSTRARSRVQDRERNKLRERFDWQFVVFSSSSTIRF